MKVKFKRVCNNLLVIEHPENSSSALLETTRIKFRFSNHACVTAISYRLSVKSENMT